SCDAVSASCSGREAPSRNEKAEWQWRSVYIEVGTRNSKTVRHSSCLGFLHPPFPGDQIFEQHSSSTTFKNHFDASTPDRLPPPFIVDAPDFADGLNGPTHPASRIPHPDRLSVCVELYCHSMGRIQGTKSVRSVPRSAFRVPRLIRAHNRSTHTAALGAATMAAPR